MYVCACFCIHYITHILLVNMSRKEARNINCNKDVITVDYVFQMKKKSKKCQQIHHFCRTHALYLASTSYISSTNNINSRNIVFETLTTIKMNGRICINMCWEGACRRFVGIHILYFTMKPQWIYQNRISINICNDDSHSNRRKKHHCDHLYVVCVRDVHDRNIGVDRPGRTNGQTDTHIIAIEYRWETGEINKTFSKA